MNRPASIRPGLLFLVVAIALSPAAFASAQEPEPEMTLPACGIRYPGGYDPNTVGVLEGRVASIDHPGRGPVSFRLVTAAETYTVFAAPAWYWEELRVRIGKGDRVRVKGSKTMGADGNLYLVAQQITVAGREKPIILRSNGGKPLWSACGPRGCGQQGH